jgi:DNA-directed RNA polymerase specialized sigma24 family protein
VEKTITKDILKDELFSGGRPAAEVLFDRYGGMLFSYIQQFVPSRAEAEDLLVNIFSRLASRLEAAFESSLSIYCWLQIEARKIILESRPNVHSRISPQEPDTRQSERKVYYSSLLEDASPEHQWVFKELFVSGRQREELALAMNRDVAYIGDILRECMIIIRKKLA